jgi:hypothetical protein
MTRNVRKNGPDVAGGGGRRRDRDAGAHHVVAVNGQPGCPCSTCGGSGAPDTERPRVDAPVNIRSAEKLGLTEPISEIYVGMYD